MPSGPTQPDTRLRRSAPDAAAKPAARGGDLFIVDNSDTDWKVRSYLADWCELSSAIDIATGYFEIGALLGLAEKWQAVDRIRILMGDEVSYRTKRAFAQGLLRINDQLDQSLETEKAHNDFLEGVPAIVEAIRSGKIQCRVYRRDKFHAKAYITHGRLAVLGSFALVGSSNFTYPGLVDNVELNVQIQGPEVGLLQDWYERYWEEAEDITPEILRTFERHTEPRTPFQIWFKALDEFFRSRELEPDAWDNQASRVFPKLDKYQQDGYRNMLTIADQYAGAFMCDGVGLGKTYIGLMLIERLVFKEKKQVVLFAPKAAREDVWEPALREHLPQVFSGFVNLKIYNHTDLQRQGHWPEELALTLAEADAVIIDEAHHFRNPGIQGLGDRAPSRYRKLQQYLHANGRPKKMYFLTATPINNSVHDFRHIVELVTGSDDRYFARTLGIHHLPRHFIDLEKRILKRVPKTDQLTLLDTDELMEAERELRADKVFDALVVQRSRTYVKESQRLFDNGRSAIFPERELPKVIPYNLRATYDDLLESVKTAFAKERPLFELSIYYPLGHLKVGQDSPVARTFDEGRQKQVVTLIRTLFLKRFESSARAFEGSCWRLLKKLLAWATVNAQTDHDRARLERWRLKNARLLDYAYDHQLEFWPEEPDEDEVEDFLDEDVLAAVDRLDPELFDVDAIMDNTLDDLEQLAEFLRLAGKVKPERDDKLRALVKLLKTDPVLKTQKVLIFTEFADTARYLDRQLREAGMEGVQRIDGGSKQAQRSDAIRRFAPYYNGRSSAQLAAEGKDEIRILISTDVLSEGLNLQDATRLINYDLHWNPVRLMQRIGRVDRRMNPAVEARLVADHPEQASLRGKVAFWNFLPPDELNELLHLYERVTSKVLVISRTLGIEGRTLLTPDDLFDPIRELNQQCDGTLSEVEQLRLEYQALLAQYPEAAAALENLPLKVFSGRESPRPDCRAVFFCYRIPRPDANLVPAEDGQPRWSLQAGLTVWACYDLAGERLATEPAEIAALIRSTPDTKRHLSVARPTLQEVRKKAEKQIVSDYLRPLQAPLGITPALKCWMELN